MTAKKSFGRNLRQRAGGVKASPGVRPPSSAALIPSLEGKESDFRALGRRFLAESLRLMVQIFRPDYVIDTVEALTPGVLSAIGVKGLFLDVDCTLKPYRATGISPAVKEWAETARHHGIGMILVSNGRPDRVRPIAADLCVPWIAPAWKPLPFALWQAAKRLGVPRVAIAMVGDQVFADVLAARLAGVRSILVRPILPGQEPWWSRWKRPLERLVLGRNASLTQKLSFDQGDRCPLCLRGAGSASEIPEESPQTSH